MADPQARTAGRRHGGRAGRGQGRRAASIIALVLGIVGFAISAAGVTIRLLPRQFTVGQQRQIMAWEIGGRWEQLPAGQIFPASVTYQLSAEALQQVAPLNLNAVRVSIAPQQSACAKAVTSATAGRCCAVTDAGPSCARPTSTRREATW